MRITVDWIACVGYLLGGLLLYISGEFTNGQALVIFLTIALMNIGTGHSHE